MCAHAELPSVFFWCGYDRLPTIRHGHYAPFPAGTVYRIDQSPRAGHLSLGQLKVMSAIERCRTAALDCRHRLPE